MHLICVHSTIKQGLIARLSPRPSTIVNDDSRNTISLVCDLPGSVLVISSPRTSRMPITFGSVGDIISISLLVKDAMKALDVSRGSGGEYQGVIREL